MPDPRVPIAGFGRGDSYIGLLAQAGEKARQVGQAIARRPQTYPTLLPKERELSVIAFAWLEAR